MPGKAITRAVLKMVRSLPGHPDLSVLDISCGDAEILEYLMNDGCRVEGTHYRDDDYILSRDRVIPSGITIHKDVDLTQPLPFPDGRFDVVLMTEVIEHLDAHIGIVHEIGRIVRPGGHLVFSTPNLNRLSSRLKFAFTGCHGICQRRTGWDMNRERLYAYHIHIPDFPVLHTLLHQAGFVIRRMGVTRIEPGHFIWILLYPVLALATRLEVRPRAKYLPARNQGERDLYRWLMHPASLMSKQLLLLAEKTNPAAGQDSGARANA